MRYSTASYHSVHVDAPTLLTCRCVLAIWRNCPGVPSCRVFSRTFPSHLGSNVLTWVANHRLLPTSWHLHMNMCFWTYVYHRRRASQALLSLLGAPCNRRTTFLLPWKRPAAFFGLVISHPAGTVRDLPSQGLRSESRHSQSVA